jgi:hypothetical protein
MLLNAIFSIIFRYATYKHYQTFNAKTWKHLTQKGIKIMSFAFVDNMIYIILAICHIKVLNGDVFLVLDW